MFLERRKSGKRIKYYLVYSYRDAKNDVKKIRRYLGVDLKQKNLSALKKRAEELIKSQIHELQTEIFNFSLSAKELAKLNSSSKHLVIHHLQNEEWKAFTEEFVYNTNAIEGSAVNLEEVHEVLKTKSPKNEEEAEAEGVAEAVEFIRNAKEGLTLDLIKKLHKLCFGKTKHFAGAFRSVEVVIRNSRGDILHRGVPSGHLHTAIEEYLSWYASNKKKFKPLVLAAIMHNQFEHIHPFQDGNGRVGRLILNFVLIKNRYPPINIMLEDRQEYYMTLQEYSKSGNLKPTMRFLLKQYKKTIKQVTIKKKKK